MRDLAALIVAICIIVIAVAISHIEEGVHKVTSASDGVTFQFAQRQAGRCLEDEAFVTNDVVGQGSCVTIDDMPKGTPVRVVAEGMRCEAGRIVVHTTVHAGGDITGSCR